MACRSALILLALIDIPVSLAQAPFICNDGCVIPATFQNDDRCDCITCEDEISWDCMICDCPTACGRYSDCLPSYSPGYGGPSGGGSHITECNDGFALQSYQVNNGDCDCASCEDEERWTCETCYGGCPASSGTDPKYCQWFQGDTFTCRNGCGIDGTKMNNDFCDCGECEDEGNWSCDTCGGCPTSLCEAGILCPVQFKCDDGCLIPNSTRNDNRCDCSGCEDETRWSCADCDCPLTSECGTGLGCGALSGQGFFACKRCSIPMDQRNDNHCDCEECEDEEAWTCDTCGGCPAQCGSASPVLCTTTSTVTTTNTNTGTTTATVTVTSDTTTATVTATQTDTEVPTATTTLSTVTTVTTTRTSTKVTTATSTRTVAPTTATVTSTVTDAVTTTSSAPPVTTTTSTPRPSTLRALGQFVADELSPFASLALDTASSDLTKTEVTMVRNDVPAGVILGFTLLKNPYAAASMPTLLQITTASSSGDGAVVSAFPSAYAQDPYPALVVATANHSAPLTSWLPSTVPYRPVGGEMIRLGTANGTLGDHFLYARMATVSSQYRIDVLAVAAAGRTYWRLTQNTSYPAAASCLRLRPDDLWTQDSVYRPSAAELQAAGISSAADFSAFWCALERGFGLLGILVPFASGSTTTTTTTTTTPSTAESSALGLQNKVLNLTGDLASTLIGQVMDPYQAVVVSKPDAPAGTSISLVSIPFPDPMSTSSFVKLAMPGDATVPIAMPASLTSSISAAYPAVSVAEVQLGTVEPAAVGLPAAFDGNPGAAVRTAEGKELKLGYKMVEVSVLELDPRGGATVLAVPSSVDPIYIRLSDQNFTDAVCAFLNSANEWSEAGTGVPTKEQISVAFGPDVAAAGGFWCSAYHLSTFAILEAGSNDGNVTAVELISDKIQQKVINWTEPLASEVIGMSSADPYASVIKQVPGLPSEITAGIITLPFADPMNTANYMTLAPLGDVRTLIAVPVEFRSPLTAAYPALTVASFATSTTALAALGVPEVLVEGMLVNTEQDQFQIGPRALEVSVVDMVSVTKLAVIEVFDQTKPIYLRLSENAFPDTAVCAWLNDLNEWSQVDVYRPPLAELEEALGSETESHGFWCATRHLSVFAILEEAPLTVVTQAPDGITGSLQNAVIALSGTMFDEALEANLGSSYVSMVFTWTNGGSISGSFVTLPMPDPSLSSNFVHLQASADEDFFIAVPAALSASHDVLSVAQFVYSTNSTAGISLPPELMEPGATIRTTDGQAAIMGPILLEVSVMNSDPSQPQAVDITGLSPPIYLRLSTDSGFADTATCAFLNGSSWSKEGTYRPDPSEVAEAFAGSALDVSYGFWCATTHLSLFAIVEPVQEEEAACAGLVIGSDCVPAAILAGAIGGPLGCCCLCGLVICCVKCRRPTAGKVKLTDKTGSSYEFGFQVVKESALSRVMRTPTSRSAKSGQQSMDPEEVEAVKIHVKWDVDVDKAQEANFDFSVGADGEKKTGTFLAVTDTAGILPTTEVKPTKSEKSVDDARSESPRSSRHRMLSEAEERVLQDLFAEENLSEDNNEEEPVSEVLIVDSPDNDSPVRIKSAVGYEAFEHGAHVEYWSATHSKWLQGAVDGQGIVVPATPDFPTYNLNLKGKSSKQRREFVDLSCIRNPFREGHHVSVRLDSEETWIPAIIVGRQSVPLGYRVLLVTEPRDGECLTLTAERVRSRFPAGQRVAVYRGLERGWQEGVVRSDKPDHEVWPQVNVEFESATEAENEVEECFQHLVQMVVQNNVSPSKSESASPTRVAV